MLNKLRAAAAAAAAAVEYSIAYIYVPIDTIYYSI